MEPILIVFIVFSVLSFAYCVYYWIRLYCKGKTQSEIPGTGTELATYDAQVPAPEPIEPGFEYEMPPPTYEEAVGEYEEPLASYGLRHRNSEDVRREETREEASEAGEESQSGEDSRENIEKDAVNADE